jgi:hypothetical protein
MHNRGLHRAQQAVEAQPSRRVEATTLVDVVDGNTVTPRQVLFNRRATRAMQAHDPALKLVGGQMRGKVRRHPLRAADSKGGYNLQHQRRIRCHRLLYSHGKA